MRRDEVITGDCIETLGALPAGCADLVFADPPFNIGYQYDVYDDRRAKADYLAWTDRWLAAAARVLSPTGSLFLAIGDEYAAEHKVRLDALGLTLRNWIVWHYTFGVNCSKKFNRSHAHIFYYVRDPKRYTFNPDAVRVPSARMTTYADRRANPVGKLPDDTWVLRPQESEEHFGADTDTWHVPRVCGTFHERLNHPCQMPEAVLERIIKVASNPGELVLDPFAGSGTTLAVAKKLDRHYLGVELSDEYADAVRKRLQMIDFAEPAKQPAPKPRRKAQKV
ncbi:modification methylase : DNA methylase N-4/N-6 domain protein OS=Pirellula staleyi (strain ATCC 27377 / DSM 6068 / ICPB 4128) GN=Psta_0519 PE=4 SV=1: N6_N4_Mtase [Gemmataceae bacterium]|nr:modification methylase : DNA methylase N-4/N-6 domain protein OS=Pirellula staleyi (strain ATCC 27377 / DSM 6068 / ICPB 4128) GN=Psta_0519 PE=4 SV=1: N6_N4_Mtase [Gemmataceae bacterium]VTT96730.1 modification methylase : DNA methylase N-4/N-6 domain protein OS=Pirellula staleyi (strain ATCC 27377 / DSM 6068 / ICPB 4128) GN=Psta_0519 PE=4 SV=1: N6_N4_Mtase [Gemmataceae bacterium]